MLSGKRDLLSVYLSLAKFLMYQNVLEYLNKGVITSPSNISSCLPPYLSFLLHVVVLLIFFIQPVYLLSSNFLFRFSWQFFACCFATCFCHLNCCLVYFLLKVRNVLQVVTTGHNVNIWIWQIGQAWPMPFPGVVGLAQLTMSHPRGRGQ